MSRNIVDVLWSFAFSSEDLERLVYAYMGLFG